MITSPPFMSSTPGPLADAGADALELLERAVRLEHGVEMPDQEDTRTGRWMIRDEVTGALEARRRPPIAF